MKKLKCNIGEYGIIVNRKGEVLILKLPTNKEFTREMWMFPGGRLETNDQGELGLKREVLEETGLKIKIITPVHTARWGNENPTKYSVFFLCRIIGKESVVLSHEHTGSRWVNFSEIEKISWLNSSKKIALKKAKIILEKGF